MDPEIDLLADLNAEDDEGLGWSVTSDARESSQVRPGVMLVAGNRHGRRWSSPAAVCPEAARRGPAPAQDQAGS